MQEKGRGRDLPIGHERYDFDVIHREGFKRGSLGGCIFEVFEFTKDTNSESPTISGRGVAKSVSYNKQKSGSLISL